MNNTPQHIAIIMDGNGRWAKQRFQPRTFGHQAGLKNVEKIVAACTKLGVNTLSLFAFSRENWQRPASEVNFLMQLIQHAIDKYSENLIRNKIRVRFIGARSNLSPELQQSMARLETLTQRNSVMNLVLAINFSGTWSILETTKKLIANGFSSDEINSETFAQARPLNDLPNVDLLIRTSGELRLSNFFLWEAAYAELYFSNCFWPDFDESQLQQAITSYQQRQRRYGALSKGYLCEKE